MKKKILIGSLLVLTLLLLMPSIPAIQQKIIQKENQTSNTSNVKYLGNEKPDLKIINVEINNYPRSGYPYVIIDIINEGSSVSWDGACRITIKKLFGTTIYMSKVVKWGANQYHSNGAVEDLNSKEFDLDDVPHLFFGRIIFEVDPNNDVDEENESNNVVWAFIFGVWRDLIDGAVGANFILGKLRQKLITYNIGSVK